MKTSIETINGKKCTVIRKPFDAEWVKEQLAMGIPVLVRYAEPNLPNESRYAVVVDDHELDFPTLYGANWKARNPIGKVGTKLLEIATILPALPRSPKPEDAPLLYRYMAEGIEAVSTLYDDGAERFVDDVDLLTMLGQLKCYGNKEVDGGSVYIQITHAIDSDGNKLEVAIHD